jgi:hypothetical protein
MAPYHDTPRVPDEARVEGIPGGIDRAPGVDAGLAEALQEVSTQLDAPSLTGSERMRLLQRQAELGDLRDELELRARRRLAPRR